MKSILVSGSHRSGTTFLGEMLALRPNVCSLFEPFNPQQGLDTISTWYRFVDMDVKDEPYFRAALSRLLEGHGHFRRIRRQAEPMWKKTARTFVGNTQNLQLLRARLDPRVTHLLLKDPIACLSSEWLHRTFGTRVVVLVRHPGAFVGSILRLNWPQDPKLWFSQQPELMRRFGLDEILADPAAEGTLMERASIAWTCIYRVLGEHLKNNPEMIALRHEDLSQNPVEEIKRIYAACGLHFDAQIAAQIEDYTGDDNPVAPTANAAHVLKRDSRNNATRWMKALTPTQVDQIYRLTNRVASKWYPDAAWSLAA